MIDLQTKVIAQVIQERKNQDRQWGGPTHDDEHTVEDWLGYIMYQRNRLVATRGLERNVLIKIAALAVAAVESLDRKIQDEH